MTQMNPRPSSHPARAVIAVCCALGLAFSTLAHAQQSRDGWYEEVEAAFADAARSLKPVVIYRAERNNRADREADAARRDVWSSVNVVEPLAQFVLLRAGNREAITALESRGIALPANFGVVFTNPGGGVLDRLSPGGVLQVDSVRMKLQAVRAAHSQDLRERIARTLASGQSQPRDIIAALEAVGMLNLTVLEDDVHQVLQRPAEATVVAAALRALAQLGTSTAIDRLAAIALDDQSTIAAAAQAALLQSEPPAALHLLPLLDTAPAAERPKIYRWVCTIAGVQSVRPGSFWTRARDALARDELQRARVAVRRAVDAWRTAVLEERS